MKKRRRKNPDDDTPEFWWLPWAMLGVTAAGIGGGIYLLVKTTQKAIAEKQASS